MVTLSANHDLYQRGHRLCWTKVKMAWQKVKARTREALGDGRGANHHHGLGCLTLVCTNEKTALGNSWSDDYVWYSWILG
jgi:hypothetical protein